MSNFSFTSTAECDYCGQMLSSSDVDCDNCTEEDIYQQFFRRIGSGSPQTIAVESTVRYKWAKLRDTLGDDWIAYEWLGPRADVETMLTLDTWGSVDELPRRATSAKANIEREA